MSLEHAQEIRERRKDGAAANYLAILALILLLIYALMSTMPIVFLSSVNRSHLRDLVRMSASFRPVLTNSMAILPSSTQVRRKWNFTSMCLLQLWSTGFFASAMVG
jgi:hypothetical protein